MGDPAKRRANYDDLLAVAETLVAEIIDGELVTQPRPATLHARAASRLGAELGGPFDRGKGGPGLIDPIARTLEAYRLAAPHWILIGTWSDDAKVRVEPFESHELELSSLWAK